MSSWRNTASVQAQDDLDALLNISLEFAQHQLDHRGEFFPFAHVVHTDGKAVAVAMDPGLGEHPPSDAVIAAYLAMLVDQREHYRAVAITADVRLSDGDAVRVELEHSDGLALTVFLPYAKKRLRKAFDYGDLVATEGKTRIWPSA